MALFNNLLSASATASLLKNCEITNIGLSWTASPTLEPKKKKKQKNKWREIFLSLKMMLRLKKFKRGVSERFLMPKYCGLCFVI